MSVVALSRPDEVSLPGRRDEAWRYSDLRGVLRALPPPAPAAETAPTFAGSFAQVTAAEVVIVNGRLASGPVATSGLAVGPDHSARPPIQGALPVLAERRAEAPPVLIRIPAGDVVLRLRLVASGEGGSSQARLRVVVEAGASLTLLESYEGSGGGSFDNTAITFELARGARLERVVLAEGAADAVSVSTAAVQLGAGSALEQTVIATGARLQRQETRVQHPGEGAKVKMDGVYLVGSARHADLTTEVVHAGPGGETSQLIKGLAAGTGRGVFQGRIVVAEGADGTDARMRHGALLLSDRAEVDAKPELEIYADDVACAHGNAIGALDEDALFYVRSRGVPEREARALLTHAFLAEAVERIVHPGAREAVEAWIGPRLEALA